jgi:hypothetical protein
VGAGGVTKLRQYTCDGFHSVAAAVTTHAAQLFAVQLARRKYGPKGRCRSVQLVRNMPTVGATTFEAFLGVLDGVAWRGGKSRFTVRPSQPG